MTLEYIIQKSTNQSNLRTNKMVFHFESNLVNLIYILSNVTSFAQK